MKKSFAIVLSVLLAMVGCTSIECPIENTVYTTYTFENTDGTTGSLGTDTLTIKTRRVDGKDTTILNKMTGTENGFDLPISYTQPEDILYFTLSTTAKKVYYDTVRIKKENYPHFESVDCQAAYFHKITAVMTTHNVIDSLVIYKSDVTYDASTEHLHLYLKADR